MHLVFPLSPVVDKEELVQDFILILVLVTILFRVSSKLKQNTYQHYTNYIVPI